ncbi:Zinc carboxypeptidase [Rubripirellula lacrimiformis]|uniref:Zinc carboxypeptidase n=1 Tax=Rubripirellula lacrimiformis TaxID=1930273 RepID=A0A517NJL6_9BACT|nr:M14-type cytosolic carboxypeptidase [Rubripirellula lacrimiformis]QDT07324.1 Zinc carboxypeptidase [Rubripirellula lacrimiformis]
MKYRLIIALLFAGASLPSPCQAAGAAPLVVDTDFEGGSATVVAIDQERSTITFMPGGDPARGWPAWWYFRVTGLSPGQTLTLTLQASDRVAAERRRAGGKPIPAYWSQPSQAAWSVDGKKWRQSRPGNLSDSAMTYELTSPGNELWVAWGPPATTGMINQWIQGIANQYDFVHSFRLSKTREGRVVHGIRIGGDGDPDRQLRPVVWLQARQHAWESGSSWVARGIGQWLVGDSEDAQWIRDNAVVYVVPIMDVDRVSTGDGGKGALPNDHNRDWSDQPHYPEVAAAQQRIGAWGTDARLAVFVDLHNPGPNDKEAFFFVPPPEVVGPAELARRSEFLDLICDVYDGQIPMTRKTRSTGPRYDPNWQKISGTWVSQHSDDQAVSVCLETPWDTPNSTIAGYESVGAGLMKGIAKFLQTEDPTQQSTE